jgi:hypothetical protein
MLSSSIFCLEMKDKDWSPRNPTLCRHLERLAKRVFKWILNQTNSGGNVRELVREEVSLKDNGSFNIATKATLDWGHLLYTNRKEIRALPGFEESVKSVSGDKEVEAFRHYGKEIPEDIADHFIFSFLLRLIARIPSLKFNHLVFDACYQETEGVIYSSTVEFRAWSALKNFDSPIDMLPIANNLRVRRRSRPEQEQRLQRALQPFSGERSLEIYRTPFVIEMEHTIPRGGPYSLEEPVRAFGRVISGLRLFKPGALGLGAIHQRTVQWQPDVGGTLSSSIYETPFFGPTYELTKAEADEFLEFYNQLVRKRPSIKGSLELAIRRFDLAYERAYPADKLIDMMIAFEALFLPERDELALRLSLRVANLLRDEEDRQEIFKKMKRAYKLRSHIVHGTEIDNKELVACVQAVEELLRKSRRSLLKSIEQGHHLRSVISQLDDATFKY